MDATIFMLSRFVIMLYFELLSLTDRTSEPAFASVMKRAPGFPLTAIFVTGFTSTVKVWTTLLPVWESATSGKRMQQASKNLKDLGLMLSTK
jgi:uncharacterized membrane protein